MASRAIAACILLVGAMMPTLAMSGDGMGRHQSAVIRFEHPTWVAGELLIGEYVIVHDEDKMERGEPCTALYRVGPRVRLLEEVVSFHCIPRERGVVRSFTSIINAAPALGIDGFDTLAEFQFAGDSEGHGVPMSTPGVAMDWLHATEPLACAK